MKRRFKIVNESFLYPFPHNARRREQKKRAARLSTCACLLLRVTLPVALEDIILFIISEAPWSGNNAPALALCVRVRMSLSERVVCVGVCVCVCVACQCECDIHYGKIKNPEPAV